MTIFSSIKQGYGRKKSKRLQDGGYERDLFKKIYEKVGGRCQLTGCHISQVFSYSFAHILPKGMFPEYRLNPNNIIFVKNLELHHWVDSVVNGRKQEFKDWIDQGIAVQKLQEMFNAELR